MQKNTVYWIEGDGIGAEIWKASRPIIDAAVKNTYNESINWVELLAGEKAVKELGNPLGNCLTFMLVCAPSSTMLALKALLSIQNVLI